MRWFIEKMISNLDEGNKNVEWNLIIQVNDNFYRLLEIEFYYNDSKEHNDS